VSVVACCSLFDGVMLLSDCRATIIRPDKSSIYCDNVQKLFALTPTTSIGFVGDILVAGKIIRELYQTMRGLRSPKRLHAFSILNWLPRYFRYSFRPFSSGQNDVTFMVASIVREKPNAIQRDKAAELMRRFSSDQLSYKRNWMPSILVNVLCTPPESKFVVLRDVPFGLLYVLRAPQFEPYFIAPLESMAVGSGEGAVTQINTHSDFIFAGEVGNSFMESLAFREAVLEFMREHKIPTVGGLYPVIKISSKGTEFIGQAEEIPVGGERIELRVAQGQTWTQLHHNSGTEIRLQPPWKLNIGNEVIERKFDFLVEARDKMEGK
jgi:hypothetical protein